MSGFTLLPAADQFMGDDANHALACRRKRRRKNDPGVCTCGLPAKIRAMQTEAMQHASQVVIYWMSLQLADGVALYDALAPGEHCEPVPVQVPAIEAGVVRATLRMAIERFRA